MTTILLTSHISTRRHQRRVRAANRKIGRGRRKTTRRYMASFNRKARKTAQRHIRRHAASSFNVAVCGRRVAICDYV
jgi:hypothetical protein